MTSYRDEVQALAQEEHAHEMGTDAAGILERRWLKWLRDCEVLYFGRIMGQREAGFDGDMQADGYSLDTMYEYHRDGLTPAQAVALLPVRP